MKLKGAILIVLLFLIVGAVSASDDVNDTICISDNVNDTISINEDNPAAIPNEEIKNIENNGNDTQTVENDTTLKGSSYNYNNIVISDQPLSHPQITVNTVSGYPGNTIVLKAIVKTEEGAAKKATVEFNFNGRTYTATTNSYGVASVQVTCPSCSSKTVSKTKGNIFTQTTTYKSTYYCDVTVNGDAYYTGYAGFSVVSKKKTVVKKYRMTKKTKTLTIKVKNGMHTYKRGNFGFVVYKFKKSPYTYILTAGVNKKTQDYIKFKVKQHLKKDGKWRWNSWFTVSKGDYSIFHYGNAVKCDKMKIKYTHITYKRIY